MHSQLGCLEQVSGHSREASEEYEPAIKANPCDSLALGDLALIRAKQHQIHAADQPWKAAFEHDPVEIGAGMNEALLECETGDRQDAAETLRRVLEFAPDDTQAHDFLAGIESGKTSCEGQENPVH